MNLDKFKGVFCALNAIYDENDNVDLEKMKALVRVYKSLGVKGVYACGSTGEGFLLSTEERKQVARAVKEAAGDDFTVIVHVGCASTKESIELAKDCEKVGVDAVSAVPCVYYHLGEESVKLHWNSIIESTSLPFIIYNIPQLTSFNLSPTLLAEMAKNPKVIGVKNSAEPVYLMERYASAAQTSNFWAAGLWEQTQVSAEHTVVCLSFSLNLTGLLIITRLKRQNHFNSRLMSVFLISFPASRFTAWQSRLCLFALVLSAVIREVRSCL